MAKKANLKKIKEIAREFANELKPKVQVEKVILFGSYAKGTAKKDSDLDFVIISSDFRKIDPWKRIEILAEARKNYEFPMDYFGLTPEEYEDASPLTTLGEVKETGKVVYSS